MKEDQDVSTGRAWVQAWGRENCWHGWCIWCVCVCVCVCREEEREIEGETKPRLDRYGEAVWMEKRVQISEPLEQ